MSEFMHTWGVGSDSNNYFTLRITPNGLIWCSGPLSESYVPPLTQEQDLENFLKDGAPVGDFRLRMEKYPKYAKHLVDAIGSLANGDPFAIYEPDRSERSWLKFAELIDKKNDLYTPRIPFQHYAWVYEPGSEYSESDGNMGSTGVFFSEMEPQELNGHYIGEVFCIFRVFFHA